jgi:competence protein ComEA
MKKYYLYIFFIIIFIISLLIPLLIKEEKEEIIVSPIVKEEIIEETIKLVKVDIKGSVKKPGVYELESSKRVIDVINKAGGLLKDANTSAINLSKVIFDEMAIYIYKKEEEILLECPVIEVLECPIVECPILENDACIEPINTKISLNNATKEELMTLTGIGETKAIDIINYRKTNKFETIEEIMNVSGVGESTFNKIKDLITI